jgi:hypothetical protein
MGGGEGPLATMKFRVTADELLLNVADRPMKLKRTK